MSELDIASLALVVSFLGVLSSFIIGVNNSICIRKNAKENNFILNVTVERNKWLERIRQDISNFCGLTTFFLKTVNDTSSNEGKEILREIDKLKYMIILRLNPSGEIDQEIITLLKEVPKLTNRVDLKGLDIAIDKLIELSQKLLKEEWEKVKDESKKGIETR